MSKNIKSLFIMKIFLLFFLDSFQKANKKVADYIKGIENNENESRKRDRKRLTEETVPINLEINIPVGTLANRNIYLIKYYILNIVCCVNKTNIYLESSSVSVEANEIDQNLINPAVVETVQTECKIFKIGSLFLS